MTEIGTSQSQQLNLGTAHLWVLLANRAEKQYTTMSYSCPFSAYKSIDDATLEEGWEWIATVALSPADSEKYYDTGLFSKEKHLMYDNNLYGYVWTRANVVTWPEDGEVEES